MAISNCRCSTLITMNGASCQSTSMIPQRRAPWPCCCGPARRPSGVEIRGHLRRMVRRIRSHWPDTRLTIRGDGHYGRPEVVVRGQWCRLIFGLAGNAVVDRLVEPDADEVRVRRAQTQAPVVRRYCETRYGAKSWHCERRVAARTEATTQGLDIRYVVINIARGSAQWL
jgi:hypothetical protein